MLTVHELECQKTFKRIMETLPYNRNSVYCKIHLDESRCDLYIPIRDNLIDKAQQAKDFYQDLANKAKL
jgi:hypothetical protein